MYQRLTERLREALAGHIREKYGVELAIVLERPPNIEMGEAASPVCFELAKRLKKAPRQIAQEIANGLGKVEGIARVEVAGGGYLNAYFDRVGFWTSVQAEQSGELRVASGEKIIVEHTSINPNKAAHIGHLRNAVLGDTMVRILRHAGNRVQIQNYIDNTGVQVADVVIALQTVKKLRPKQVCELIRTFKHYRQTGSARIAPLLPRTNLGLSIRRDVRKYQGRLDYYCWDLYARISQILSKDKKAAKKVRGKTLKAIESGKGGTAEIAQLVADEIVSAHLQTMARLDIHYDLLARESEILHLKFWDTAFRMLKKSGAIHRARSGKMAGCWIMPWGEEEMEEQWATKEEAEAHAKIIVRSDGTVTYVGKDIAYQLWKFGLLRKDFHYKKWSNAPDGRTVWATTSDRDDPTAPHFGEAASRVYNVIDARQTYLQKVVSVGLSALGHRAQADRSIHLSYEIVALTPQCAAEMGYQLGPEEVKKPHVEVSGRKGLGVKADDLIDRLEMATESQVLSRHPDMDLIARKNISHAIAIGALRFFLLKFTRNAIIAFDFKDALNFEGEAGPYCQYAIVRARSIWRRSAEESPEIDSTRAIQDASGLLRASSGTLAEAFLQSDDNKDIWGLLLQAGSLDQAVDTTIGAQEPAFLARYTLQLAQAFNNFYHKHHILSEADEQKRTFLLRLTELVEAQLVRALSLLGISAPEKM